VPQPKFPKTLWISASIAQVRVPETPEGMMASLVGAGERVDEPQLLQRWVKVPAQGSRSSVNDSVVYIRPFYVYVICIAII
jgi:hypothetical protein